MIAPVALRIVRSIAAAARGAQAQRFPTSLRCAGWFLLSLAMASAKLLAQSSTVPQGCNGVQLIGPKAVARTLIPTQDLGVEWTVIGYDDKDWIRGITGVGYELGSSPYASGLVLYHTMDKADLGNGIVKDVSGPTLHPGGVVGSVGNSPGQIAQALSFKGDSASYVKVSHHTELDPGSGAFSVALWFKGLRGGSAANGTAFSEVLIGKLAADGTTTQNGVGWSIYRNQTGTFVQTAASAGVRTVPLGSTSAGAWHHVVLVVNRAPGQLVGYLDGKRMGAVTLGATPPEAISSVADLLEARDLAGNQPFAGLLDDVAIWSRAMTDAQVAELYSVGKSGKSFLDGTAFPNNSLLYNGLIGTDVLAKMRGQSASAYIRVPFNLPVVPSLASALKLRVHYDDGFVAYLNGSEVARRNAPVTVDDLSTSDSDRPDTAALTAEIIDLTDFVSLLRPGGNVLAFHALNSDPNATRFLLYPIQLCVEVDRNTNPAGDCVKETNGRDFWIAFPENYVQEADTPLRLTVCITGLPQTQGVVEIPGLPVNGFPKNFIIPASGAVRMVIPRVVELSGSDKIEPKAVHITASADVAVYGTTRMDYTTDTFLGLPTKCLGTEYLVCSYKNVFNGFPVLNGTQFAIVAVANNTEVTIVPQIKVGAHLANQPFTIALNRGETYQLRNESGQPADLTGTEIVANKPIAVFGSHRCANIESVNQFFCDTVLEELLPITSWGSSFFIVPLVTRQSDTVRVLSAADENLVTVTTLSGSQSFVLGFAQYKDLVLKDPTRITCRQPATVMQFANSSDADHVINADPFMAMIQPSNTWLSDYRICTPLPSEFEDNYINLVATTQAFLENTSINGTLVAAWPAADISKGNLPSGAVFARIKLQPATSYVIHGRAPLGLTAYGFSEFDSYGYPGGMRFTDSSPPVIICPPEVTVNCSAVAGAADCIAPIPDFTLKSGFFDDCTPERQLIVSQEPKAGTVVKPGTYSVTITATDGKGNKSQCVVKFTVESTWEQQQFGPTIANNASLEATVWGDQADPDKDGWSNEVEKALGSNPNQGEKLTDLVQLKTGEDQGSAFLLITVPRLVGTGGPEIELEGVNSLDGSPWESGPDIFEELPGLNVPKPGGKYEQATFKARYTQGDGSTTAFFLRLKIKP